MLVDDYLEYQLKYEKLYGKSTIVLMEVGSFFEIYGIDKQNEQGSVQKISELLNIQMTKKNKSNDEISIHNPLMAGVPSGAINKYLTLLLNNNYTIVLVEQVTPPPKPERKVTRILSPGTNFELSQSESTFLCSIYLEELNDIKNNVKLISGGISCIDLNTGQNKVYEIHSLPSDKDLCKEEMFRFIQTYNPREIIINLSNIELSKDEIINFFELNDKVVHINYKIDNNYTKLSYQNDLLNNIFKCNTMLSPIEYLDLEKYPFSLISYIALLNFAYEHDETIITKIEKPDIWICEKHLILSNNAINQLNVVSNKNESGYSGRYDSLFNVLNKVSTSMGRRLLRDRLLNPIVNEIKLNKRYDLIEIMINENKYQEFDKNLNKIIDIERYHRKLSLGLLQPYDIASIDLSYQYVIELINLSIKYNLKDLMPSENSMLKFKEFIDNYKNIFDIDEIKKHSLSDITKNFFKKGIYDKLDKYQKEIDSSKSIFQVICKSLSNLIEKNSDFIKKDRNDRDNDYLLLTNKRCDILRKKLDDYKKKEKTTIIKLKIMDSDFELDFSTFYYKVEKNNTKIIIKSLEKNEERLSYYQEKLFKQCQIYFKEKIMEYDSEYSEILKEIVKFVSEVDLIKSSAKVAIDYGYIRPEIDSNELEFSYFDAKGIRHPIIERLQTNLEYIPNDVSLGKDTLKGILLYSVNAAGKSSLMKSIGLNIIMAQAGMYVACENFKYKPYHKLFTRISGNDNLFKGQSSFAVEMSELRGILKRSDSFGLVLGDELCSGTESDSALAIVASGVKKLSEKKTSFIFATHLHQLSSMDIINNLNNVKHFHLKVNYNESTKTLIYDRKIAEGSGSSIYGLEVCRAMDLDPDFINDANEIRKNLKNISNHIINTKVSKYNSDVYINKCGICNKNADDVHHIKFQSLADKNGFIVNIHKDVKSNLVPVCKQCHIDIHNYKIDVNGYINTSEGIVLDYKNNIDSKKCTTKKKYNDEQIEIIKGLKELAKNKKEAIHLAKKQNIDISQTTLSKIWNNNYIL